MLSLCDTVACEDTRHSQTLLRAYGIDKSASHWLALHQHNEAEASEEVIRRLQAGQRVAYVSDAGTPAVSDYTTGGSLASSPGLALDTSGQLYVSDQTYNINTQIASGPVKRFDAAGNYFGEVIADGASGLAGPAGLAISGNTLYTSSIMSGTILQTDLETDITTAFATTGSPFEVGPLALLSDGSLLAGSPSGNGNIYQFGTDGTLLSTFASGLGQVGGIVTATAVPEPGTLGLAVIGILAGGLWLRQRRRV